MSDRNDLLRQLHTELHSRFNISEVKNLCFELDVPFEDIPGNTKRELIQELIEYLDRRGQIKRLVSLAQAKRTGEHWPSELENLGVMPRVPIEGVSPSIVRKRPMGFWIGLLSLVSILCAASIWMSRSIFDPSPAPADVVVVTGTPNEVIDDRGSNPISTEEATMETITPTESATAIPTKTPTSTPTAEQSISTSTPTHIPPTATIPSTFTPTPTIDSVTYEVNKTVRSTTNPDITVTWLDVELDDQSDTTTLHIRYENTSNETLRIEVIPDNTYLGFEDGGRVFSTNVGPSSITNQFGNVSVEVQPGTNIVAWVEFSGLIDISQELHLLLYAGAGGTERFPVINRVTVDLLGNPLPVNSDDSESSEGVMYLVNKAVQSTTNPDMTVTWLDLELDDQSDTTTLHIRYENTGNEALRIEVIPENTYLGFKDGSRVFSTNVGPSSIMNQFGNVSAQVQPGTNIVAWIEFSELIDISQELHLLLYAGAGGTERFPVINKVNIDFSGNPPPVSSGGSDLLEADYAVNKAVRSTVNPDITATWLDVDLDESLDSTRVRIRYENDSNDVVTVEIRPDGTYIGFEDGTQIDATSVGPSTVVDRFGKVNTQLQPGTNIVAWIEFSGLIDVSQELNLLLYAGTGGTERFPVINGVSLE